MFDRLKKKLKDKKGDTKKFGEILHENITDEDREKMKRTEEEYRKKRKNRNDPREWFKKK